MFIIEDVGEFRWAASHWHCIFNLNDREIYLGIPGTREALQDLAVTQIRQLLKNIGRLETQARTLLRDEGLEAYLQPSGELYLSAISAHEEAGKFDIEFGLTLSEDDFVIVHFKHDQAYSISLGN